MYNQISLWDYLPDNNMKVENQVNKKTIISTDGEVILYLNFFSTKESNQLFSDLYSSVNWKQEIIQFFGKQMPIPRLTAWHGDEGKSYTYSGIEQHPEPWNPTLKLIKSEKGISSNLCSKFREINSLLSCLTNAVSVIKDKT